MSLIQSSNPAMRESGCFFSQRFETADDVEKGGGVVTGTVEYPGNGVVLGTGDKIKYKPANKTLSKVSFVLEFVPDFAPNDDAFHVLFATEDNVFRMYKHSSAVGNALYVVCNEAVVTSPLATYSQYWNPYGTNKIAFYSESGSSRIYLNGTRIDTFGYTTAWTPFALTELNIGSGGVAATGSANSTIRGFDLYSEKLSDRDTMLLSQGGDIWNYMNQAYVHYPMDLANIDPDGTKIMEIRQGKHATISGSVTKNATSKGYYFAGSDDYATTGVLGGTFSTFTVAILFRAIPAAAIYSILTAEGTPSGIGFVLKRTTTTLQAFVGGAGGANAATSTYTLPNSYKCHSLIARYDGINTSIWVNGAKGANATTPLAPVNLAGSILTFAARRGLTDDFPGDIADVMIWDGYLTDMQIADLAIKQKLTINNL